LSGSPCPATPFRARLFIRISRCFIFNFRIFWKYQPAYISHMEVNRYLHSQLQEHIVAGMTCHRGQALYHATGNRPVCQLTSRAGMPSLPQAVCNCKE
jgi:hypothetical protein